MPAFRLDPREIVGGPAAHIRVHIMARSYASGRSDNPELCRRHHRRPFPMSCDGLRLDKIVEGSKEGRKEEVSTCDRPNSKGKMRTKTPICALPRQLPQSRGETRQYSLRCRELSRYLLATHPHSGVYPRVCQYIYKKTVT